jgi:hypothetical protein
LWQLVLAKDNSVWKFFAGACVLTVAMLQPHAPIKAIAAGMGLAALVFSAWLFSNRARPHDSGIDESNRNRNGRDR